VTHPDNKTLVCPASGRPVLSLAERSGTVIAFGTREDQRGANPMGLTLAYRTAAPLPPLLHAAVARGARYLYSKVNKGLVLVLLLLLKSARACPSIVCRGFLFRFRARPSATLPSLVLVRSSS